MKSLSLVFERSDAPEQRLLPDRERRRGTLRNLRRRHDGTLLEVCRFESGEGLDEELAADDAVLDFETFPAERPSTARWCFARVRPGERVAEWLDHVERFRLLLDTPIRFDAASVRVRVVGTAERISAAAAALPEAARADMRVEQLTEFDPATDELRAALTGRQREVLAAAVDVGYYADPREATVEDVADALGVAPSTVSEHLRKLEARVFSRLT